MNPSVSYLSVTDKITPFNDKGTKNASTNSGQPVDPTQTAKAQMWRSTGALGPRRGKARLTVGAGMLFSRWPLS